MTVYYRSAGIQAIPREYLDNALEPVNHSLVVEPVYVPDYMWSGTASSGSHITPFPYEAGLNQIADTMNLKKSLDDPQNKQAFTKITLIINGGTRGLEQRGSNWEAGLQFIKDHPRAIALGVTIVILALVTGGYYYFNRDTIKADLQSN